MKNFRTSLRFALAAVLRVIARIRRQPKPNRPTAQEYAAAFAHCFYPACCRNSIARNRLMAEILRKLQASETAKRPATNDPINDLT
jgi:hypothetical protein